MNPTDLILNHMPLNVALTPSDVGRQIADNAPPCFTPDMVLIRSELEELWVRGRINRYTEPITGLTFYTRSR